MYTKMIVDTDARNGLVTGSEKEMPLTLRPSGDECRPMNLAAWSILDIHFRMKELPRSFREGVPWNED